MTKFPHSLEETTAALIEPVTLSMMKVHMRIDHDADDTVLIRLASLARQVCEDYTGRALIQRSYSLYMDKWPATARASAWWDGMREGADISGSSRRLSLPRTPLMSVTAIIQHAVDDSIVTYSVDNYFVDAATQPGRIVLKDGAPAPSGSRVANGIEIRFIAGYGAVAEDVPPALKQGMLQLVAHFYEHRGDDYNSALRTSGAVTLFEPYRMMTL